MVLGKMYQAQFKGTNRANTLSLYSEDSVTMESANIELLYGVNICFPSRQIR